MGMEAKKRPRKVSPELRLIGKRAGQARERTGMTRAKLAEKLGIHHSQISRFETGSRTLELETILRLCDALGAPKGYVFGGEGELPEVEFVETDGRKRPRAETERR